MSYGDSTFSIERSTSSERGILVRLFGPREVVQAFDGETLTDLRNRLRACDPEARIEDIVLDVDPEMPDWTRTDGLIDTHES